MSMAEIPQPQDYVDEELASKAIIGSVLCAIAGIAMTVWFAGSPSYELTVGTGLLGGGVAGATFFDMYRYQPKMNTSQILPYMVLLGFGVLLISNGVGGGFVEVPVGVGFFVLMGLTVLALSRLFEYQG